MERIKTYMVLCDIQEKQEREILTTERSSHNQTNHKNEPLALALEKLQQKICCLEQEIMLLQKKHVRSEKDVWQYIVTLERALDEKKR